MSNSALIFNPAFVRVPPMRFTTTDRLIKRLASPVLGDVAEHPVLDLVPLARARREVADGDP